MTTVLLFALALVCMGLIGLSESPIINFAKGSAGDSVMPPTVEVTRYEQFWTLLPPSLDIVSVKTKVVMKSVSGPLVVGVVPLSLSRFRQNINILNFTIQNTAANFTIKDAVRWRLLEFILSEPLPEGVSTTLDLSYDIQSGLCQPENNKHPNIYFFDPTWAGAVAHKGTELDVVYRVVASHFDALTVKINGKPGTNISVSAQGFEFFTTLRSVPNRFRCAVTSQEVTYSADWCWSPDPYVLWTQVLQGLAGLIGLVLICICCGCWDWRKQRARGSTVNPVATTNPASDGGGGGGGCGGSCGG
eukprot:c15815_g1_i1.p1 GENE.c15815_g1_i1~~c15815_g1_i1.p1  ORF type:complete len:303 (+),score=35.60 c15815_g1_i1:1067-1975(+)